MAALVVIFVPLNGAEHLSGEEHSGCVGFGNRNMCNRANDRIILTNQLVCQFKGLLRKDAEKNHASRCRKVDTD
jgi:hypothetical protein